MDLAALLRAQSQAVHQRLLDGEKYRVQQQEETITESLLLEIAKSSPSDVKITLSTRPEESRTGADWAWWWQGARDCFGPALSFIDSGFASSGRLVGGGVVGRPI